MRYALSAVRRRPGRSAATALGIGLAAALVVVLLAVSEGIQTSAAELAAESGVDLLVTSGNATLTSRSFPLVADAHALPARLTDADPNVGTVSPWLLASLTFANASLRAAAADGTVPPGWGPLGAGTVGWLPNASQGLQLPPILVGPGYPSAGDPHFDGGRYDGPRTGAIVLDQGLAAVLHVAPGDTIYAGATTPAGPSELPGWFATAAPFTVVGISGPYWLVPSELLGFVYLSELQSLLAPAGGAIDGASLVLVHLHDPTRASADQATLQRAFPTLSVFTLSDILSEIQHTVELYRSFGTLVGLVGLVVATLFTTTVLLMGVDDRSRELALLRALGFPSRTIVRYVVEEGMVLAALGLATGLLLGFGGAVAMDRVLQGLVTGLPAGFSFVRFDASVLASSTLAVLAVGLAASVLPAARALRLPVAEELRAP